MIIFIEKLFIDVLVHVYAYAQRPEEDSGLLGAVVIGSWNLSNIDAGT